MTGYGRGGHGRGDSGFGRAKPAEVGEEHDVTNFTISERGVGMAEFGPSSTLSWKLERGDT